MVEAKLDCYYTLWGHVGSSSDAAKAAVESSYQGIEGPVPRGEFEKRELGDCLREFQLDYICEIATTGTYIPDRSLSVHDHLADLKTQLQNAETLRPRFITCLGGCDAWSKDQSIEFLCAATELAQQHNLDISFETHRGRSLFNPWITRDVVAEIPDIKLTFDISHWSVVCEGLQATELELLQRLSCNTHHIHARVGYDQGPQVPDPQQGVYQHDLLLHLKAWKRMWQQQILSGKTSLTITPEFGLDGYQYRNVGGESTLVDVRNINQRMCQILQNEFSQLIDNLNNDRPMNHEQRAF